MSFLLFYLLNLANLLNLAKPFRFLWNLDIFCQQMRAASDDFKSLKKEKNIIVEEFIHPFSGLANDTGTWNVTLCLCTGYVHRVCPALSIVILFPLDVKSLLAEEVTAGRCLPLRPSCMKLRTLDKIITLQPLFTHVRVVPSSSYGNLHAWAQYSQDCVWGMYTCPPRPLHRPTISSLATRSEPSRALGLVTGKCMGGGGNVSYMRAQPLISFSSLWCHYIKL